MISRIFLGEAMRATPPSARICAGTRSRAMTATAPARSAMVGLLGVGDVHDDAALEHFGEAGFEAKAGGVVRCFATWRFSFPGTGDSRQRSAVSHQLNQLGDAGDLVALTFILQGVHGLRNPGGIAPTSCRRRQRCRFYRRRGWRIRRTPEAGRRRIERKSPCTVRR